MCKRIGHGGAPAVVRGNTLESFDAALEIGVDMIEFDVRNHQGELVLSHSRVLRRGPDRARLDAALAHLSQPRFGGMELNVDVKTPGCERAVLGSLKRYGLMDRSLVSSQLPCVVDRFRELDPSLRTAISVGGRLSRRWQRWGDWRRAVLEAMRSRRFDALMAYHGLVDAGLVRGIADLGAEVYAWTVDDRLAMDRLSRLGVNGIVTNDPRLFAPLPPG